MFFHWIKWSTHQPSKQCVLVLSVKVCSIMIRCIYNWKFPLRFHPSKVDVFTNNFHFLVKCLRIRISPHYIKKPIWVIFIDNFQISSPDTNLPKTDCTAGSAEVVGLTGFVFEGVAISLALYLKEAIQHPDGERPKMLPRSITETCGSCIKLLISTMIR